MTRSAGWHGSRSSPPRRNKIISARAAVDIVKSGDTLATSGFVGIGVPDAILAALAERFSETAAASADGIGTPRGLTLVFGSSQGDFKERGLNRLALPGLISRIIGGHFGAAPKLQKLILSGEVEAYNLPQGVVTHLFRDIAAGRPAHLSRVGIGTYVDPRHGGGKLNSRTSADLVQLTSVNGEDALLYATFPIDIAILRGTTADADGNVTMEREALTLEALAIAMAARNSNGIVIAQVERLAAPGTLNSRQVKIPGILVDHIVVAENQHHHMQTFAEPYNAAFAGEIRVPNPSKNSLKLGLRKVIARRAALELRADTVVNLGIGIPEGVAAVAAEEDIIQSLTLTAEPGVIGGIPASGLNFGASVNAASIIDQPYQFDFYDGGGIDLAILGIAEVDVEGNVNVSRFAARVPGAGGFINITQNAKSLVFAGTFTAGGIDVEVRDGKLAIRKEGQFRKFVKAVAHRTFVGARSLKDQQSVLYVTERCVFRLTHQGLELIEVVPGIDIRRDILENMDFEPIVRDPVQMNSALFVEGRMNLRAMALSSGA